MPHHPQSAPMNADIALTHPAHLGAPAWSPNGQALLVEMRDSRYAPTQIARLVRSGATSWAVADPAAPKVFGKQTVVIAQGVVPTPTPRATGTPEPVDIPETADVLLGSLPAPSPDELLLARSLLDTATDLNDLRLPRTLYGDCEPGVVVDRSICARYVYAAFYAFFEVYIGAPPTIWDWLSATYTGELRTWLDSYQEPLEALTRNFFDPTAGGCRYIQSLAIYRCTHAQIIEWASGIEFWYRYALNSGGDQVRVRMMDVIGIPQRRLSLLAEEARPISPTDLRELFEQGGMFDFDGFIQGGRVGVTAGVPANLTVWRTGQGPDVPSTWGNSVLPAGTTTFDPSPERFVPLIIHLFPERRSTISPPPNIQTILNGQPATCTYVAVVTTTDGRLSNLSVCSVE